MFAAQDEAAQNIRTETPERARWTHDKVALPSAARTCPYPSHPAQAACTYTVAEERTRASQAATSESFVTIGDVEGPQGAAVASAVELCAVLQSTRV